MFNSSIFLQSENLNLLQLQCIEESFTDHQGQVYTNRIWIDTENDLLIDIQLYPLLDTAQVNQKILINDQSFTVTQTNKSLDLKTQSPNI
ncbi:hypothetical protein [Acinetobacter rathckeae]|uniref:hypothetical protein n=1 Tax=Acinetobacter rathckeae TaxID=2605272 RepID=UPI0018A2EAEA|nr:hypothetical protein [Acinetobacter rathckeae]MBF7688137.1 hypothetical protein [Acinetobacter rathckeae]MBF7695351.1 hypothetical protein [Acinetobacter rathckeae]